MSDEEVRRSVELKEYFAVLPAFRGIYNDISYNYPDLISNEIEKPYISSEQTPLNVNEIKNFLIGHNLLDKPTWKSG